MDEALPTDSRSMRFPFSDDDPGYPNAIELRFARGDFGDGDVMAWIRTRVDILEGVTPLPIERVLVAADSGNGVRSKGEWLFAPTKIPTCRLSISFKNYWIYN